MTAIRPAIRSAIQPAIRSAFAGSYGWLPTSLFAAGEQGVWYDPSDFSTMYQDSAGTTPVTAIGDPVGKILDKSGNGNHATQATAASRPVLQVASGKYYLDFDGTDDYLVTAAIDFSGSDEMSMFVGAYVVGYAGATQRIVNLNGTTPPYQQIGLNTTASLQYYGGGTTAKAAAWVSLPEPSTVVAAGRNKISTDNISLRVNGAERGTNAADQGTGNMANAALALGARSTGVGPFNGGLYSVIMLGRYVSDAEIALAESYVAGKSGVTL